MKLERIIAGKMRLMGLMSLIGLMGLLGSCSQDQVIGPVTEKGTPVEGGSFSRQQDGLDDSDMFLPN